jgi:peptide/nickel transport system substrate-binding protein
MNIRHGFIAAIAAGALLCGVAAARAQGGTIRFVPQSEATIFDPVTSVIAVTQQHAYMIYDTLFSLDANGVPQPQMVDTVTRDPSGRVYTMTLRAGLKFHDGSAVRAADAVASIKRWARRDVVGTRLVQLGMKVAVVDDKTFTVETTEPTALVLEGFAKPTSSALFVMREQDAMNEPTKAVTANIGSGPFKFVAGEYVSGSKLVYERNRDYVPRAEPVSYFSGGKKVNVDRVEFVIIPDAATAVSALSTGEVDIYEAPPLDLLPVLQQRPGVKTRVLNKNGIMAVLRPNHLHPPFDNPKARQALMMMVDQDEYMAVAGGPDKANWLPCKSFLGCGLPSTTQAGTEIYASQNIEKAKQLLKESGYKNEPVTVMQPADQALVRDLTEVTVATMRKVGFNVNVLAIDWATMLQRRDSQAAPDKGGWNIFHTWSYSFELTNPVANFLLTAPCGGKGWFGWACDEKLEKLRSDWASESDPAKRKALYEQVQIRSAEIIPYVPLGQFLSPIAYRDRVDGLVDAPLTIFWNMTKKS